MWCVHRGSVGTDAPASAFAGIGPKWRPVRCSTARTLQGESPRSARRRPAGLLLGQDDQGVWLRDVTSGGPYLDLHRVTEPKTSKLRVHIDVAPLAGDDHTAEIERLRALGARQIDIGQGDVSWIVLADPEGNELLGADPSLTWCPRPAGRRELRRGQLRSRPRRPR